MDRPRSRSSRWPGRARPSAGPTCTVATTSFGHGIAVTPLQFIDAVGGAGRRRHAGAADPAAARRRRPMPPRTRYVAAHTAEMMRWLMWLAVEQGTGTQAQARQLPDRRQDRHRREAQPRRLQPATGCSPRSWARSRSTTRATWCSCRSTSRRATPRTHGLRYGGWTAAPVVARDHRPDRAGPRRAADAARGGGAVIAPGWRPSACKQPRPTVRQEASLAPGSAVR